MRVVLVLAEELHFGRAAARLHVVQSAVSQTLKDLEEELGTELFARNRHGVALTAAGAHFRDHARRALEEIASATSAALATEMGATPTLLRDAQAKLHESERLLRSVFDASRDALLLADDRGEYVDANPAACNLFGLPRAQLIGRTLLDFAAPGDDAAAAYQGFLKQGSMEGDFHLRRPDGDLRILDYGVMANVTPGRHLSAFRDITDRVRSEKAVRESRRQLEDAQAIAFHVDFDGAAARLQLVTAGHHRGEMTIRRPNGALRLVEFTADANILPGVHLALLRDVTEQKAADERRRQLAAIVDASDEAIIGTDADGVITSWNPSAERMLQWSASEAIGRSFDLLVPLDVDDRSEDRSDHVRRGEVVRNVETAHRRKDGSTVETMMTVSPIFNASGQVVGSARIVRDMTQARKSSARIRQVEAQLQQAEKMNAIGLLAGGVAHDFNNLLSVILTFAYLVLGDLKLDDPIREDIQEISRAGTRATDLTRQLLAFSRKQVLQPVVLDLAETVLGTEKMLRRLLGAAIELSLRTPPALGRVLADPSQIEQIVMNLSVNARDAMPSGGKLIIETVNVQLDAEYAAAHEGVVPGPYVMLAISDTGHGMDAATRERIFDPFFTTKEVGKGTGLGLSTVFGIVKQSQGHIWVYSEPGRGTTFKVYLPRVDQPVGALSVAPPQPETLYGAETVLVVEDEEQVRASTRAVLERHGYNVLDAHNGGEALLICEQFPSKIDLLLTDVVLPRMTGRQVAARLAPMRPEMKVLYVSGYTEDAIFHQGVVDAGVAFLEKPITPSGLLRKVREVLDSQRLEELDVRDK